MVATTSPPADWNLFASRLACSFPGSPVRFREFWFVSQARGMNGSGKKTVRFAVSHHEGDRQKLANALNSHWTD
jgi:hypothetical protein